MFDLNTKQVVISLETLADLLAEANEEVDSIFVGGCVSNQIVHPKYGRVVLIQTPNSEECLAIKL